MKKLIIDGEGVSLGRIASYIAKQALSGNEVIVLNSEKVIIEGNPIQTIEKYLEKTRRGKGVQKGPQISRAPEQLLRRAIRGMVGHKKPTGKEAYKRVKCFQGVYKEFEGLEKTPLSKKEVLKVITLKDLSKAIGGKELSPTEHRIK
jgi:large subunit ribosomal protein L13